MLVTLMPIRRCRFRHDFRHYAAPLFFADAPMLLDYAMPCLRHFADIFLLLLLYAAVTLRYDFLRAAAFRC